MKPSTIDSEDGADKVTNGDVDIEDELTFTDNGEDGTTSPDNVQVCSHFVFNWNFELFGCLIQFKLLFYNVISF